LAARRAEARRRPPRPGTEQLLTTSLLNGVLRPDRPDDALAYLAFTAGDLWPGMGWNFVFGQASLRERTGVWSLHRHGDPAGGPEAFRLCLRRTLATASHETGHILTMQHCTAFACNMNGSNSLEEAGRPAAAPLPGLPAQAVLEPPGRARRALPPAARLLPRARPGRRRRLVRSRRRAAAPRRAGALRHRPHPQLDLACLSTSRT